MAIMKKLNLFWRLSDCPVYIKVYTAGTKIETFIWTRTSTTNTFSVKQLETFQLKVLRKIFKIDTTYINRVNIDISIFNRINTMMEEEGKRKRVISFVDAYNKITKKEQSKS